MQANPLPFSIFNFYFLSYFLIFIRSFFLFFSHAFSCLASFLLSCIFPVFLLIFSRCLCLSPFPPSLSLSLFSSLFSSNSNFQPSLTPYSPNPTITNPAPLALPIFAIFASSAEFIPYERGDEGCSRGNTAVELHRLECPCL